MAQDASYYQIAQKASRQIGSHPGLTDLQQRIQNSGSVLDLGCGEGSRLASMMGKRVGGIGIDINRYAINLARKSYPQHKYIAYSGKKLPFSANSFGLVYSAFVLEHTQNQQHFINEAIRVLQHNGILIILCPNFGAPSRRSPNSVENPLTKLYRGFTDDFRHRDLTSLGWTKVVPQKTYDNIDDDTTVEPYVRTLGTYLQFMGFKILIQSSLWQLEPASYNPRKLLFAVLGKLGVYPLKYWGPQVWVVAQKNRNSYPPT